MHEFFGIRTDFRNVTFLKVKQVNFTLGQAMKAQMGVGVSLYSFFNHGIRLEWVFNATHRVMYIKPSRTKINLNYI